MLYIGIDFGKVCGIAVLDKRMLVYVSKVKKEKIKSTVMSFRRGIVAIDSPLSIPNNSFRSCDEELIKRGIPCFPPKMFLKTVLDAIKLAENLRAKHEVIEVYPYATRVVLNIAPKAKKATASGRREIQISLKRFVENIPERILSHDELDAVLCALTARLKSQNLCEKIECREGGAIYIPLKI